MKTKLKLTKLANVLPDATKEALHSGGFFDADSEEFYVKRRSAITELEQLEEGERAVRQYISTRDVDRDRDILVPKGAVLDQFLLAPQVLWGHDYSLPPIGSASAVVTDAKGIRAKTVFADTPRAEEVWQLVRQGHLKTASVGFIPLDMTWKGDKNWSQTADKLSRQWDTDIEKSGAERIITKWLLLEYSMVPVPANINALVTAVAKGLSLSSDLQEELGLDEVEPEPEAPVEEKEPRRIVLPVKSTRRIVKVIQRPGEPVDAKSIATETLAQLRGKV